MEDPKLSFYFRRLRMIYCREQQLVEFLPDLISEADSLPLKEAMSGYLAAARCRRYMIKDLAWDHGISPLGEECQAMKKLIAVGSARLAAGKRGEHHDPAVDAFCHQRHRVIMVDYRLTRYLAMEHYLDADIGCFDEVIGSLTATFPEPVAHRIRAMESQGRRLIPERAAARVAAGHESPQMGSGNLVAGS
jgi:hypothetical protein